MTALVGLALVGAAVATSVAAAPIWRRTAGSDPSNGPAWRARVGAAAVRAWRDRRASRWSPVGAAVLCGAAGLAAGPVMAAVLAAYGATGVVVVRGIAVRRSRRRAYRLAADAVVGLAADLRAGVALAPAWRIAQESLRVARSSVLPDWHAERAARAGDGAGDDISVVASRVLAATSLAQASGAPLADVLDRLDAHLRATDRARSVADSQAAGARVSAGLLAAMPVAGVGLGAVLGVDATRVLLHTPLGALAVGLGLLLQVGGLAWAARLADAGVSP